MCLRQVEGLKPDLVSASGCISIDRNVEKYLMNELTIPDVLQIYSVSGVNDLMVELNVFK